MAAVVSAAGNMRLSLLEVDVLGELDAAAVPSVAAPAVAVACKIELPRAVSILNTLRRLGLVSIHASGLGTETRWRITELGQLERRRNAQLRLAP